MYRSVRARLRDALYVLHLDGMLFGRSQAQAAAELAQIPAAIKDAERRASQAPLLTKMPMLGNFTVKPAQQPAMEHQAEAELSRIYLWLATPEGSAVLNKCATADGSMQAMKPRMPTTRALLRPSLLPPVSLLTVPSLIAVAR